MNKSETIMELTKALSKAQATMEGSIKDASNPFFKSEYSTLSSVWEACRKPLTDNGLAVIQTAAFIPEHPEMVAIETTLSHSSGEFVTGIMAAKPVKSDPQSIGSCVTYLRRYSLAAICGVSPEDDDGNAATGQDKAKEKKTPPAQSSSEKPPQDNIRKVLEIKIGESGIDRDIMKEYLASVGWVTEKDGRLSMTTLADKNVKTILEKWDSFKAQVSTFADKKNFMEAAK
jgi:hypothetical protein